VKKGVGNLSGGESARLTFCRLSVTQPNVLVLDEPTNHLDLEAIDALVEGLKTYDGTLVFVSHDRWFVSRLANRILEITPTGIRDYKGTYEEYIEAMGDDHLDAEAVLRMRRAQQKKAKDTPRLDDKEREKRQRSLSKRRDELTVAIDKAESRVHAINELFCDPTFFDRTSRDQVKKLEQEQHQLNAKVGELMGEWETVEAELGDLAG
jgi:ABC-type multidrug transport system ATPase subunit